MEYTQEKCISNHIVCAKPSSSPGRVKELCLKDVKKRIIFLSLFQFVETYTDFPLGWLMILNSSEASLTSIISWSKCYCGLFIISQMRTASHSTLDWGWSFGFRRYGTLQWAQDIRSCPGKYLLQYKSLKLFGVKGKNDTNIKGQNNWPYCPASCLCYRFPGGSGQTPSTALSIPVFKIRKVVLSIYRDEF